MVLELFHVVHCEYKKVCLRDVEINEYFVAALAAKTSKEQRCNLLEAIRHLNKNHKDSKLLDDCLSLNDYIGVIESASDFAIYI